MKIGALIVTTGLPRVSGVTALISEIGTTSAGQRMISAFQCAGVSMIGLVVGPENKKIERQFSQSGVIFLRCKTDTSFLDGVREGLRFMFGKYDRIFVLPGDMPLFLPETLRSLLRSTAHIAVPVNSHMNGAPILLDKTAMNALLAHTASTTLEDAIAGCALDIELVPVSDSGIFLRGEDMSHREGIIRQQDQQLTRPVLDVSLHNGTLLYDPRLSMLLHLIEETCSVRDACSLMQISYSSAWNMLNHVEDKLGFPLIVRNRGGASGNGSLLTEKGKALMDAYDHFSEHLNQEAQQLYTKLFDTSQWI